MMRPQRGQFYSKKRFKCNILVRKYFIFVSLFYFNRISACLHNMNYKTVDASRFYIRDLHALYIYNVIAGIIITWQTREFLFLKITILIFEYYRVEYDWWYLYWRLISLIFNKMESYIVKDEWVWYGTYATIVEEYKSNFEDRQVWHDNTW